MKSSTRAWIFLTLTSLAFLLIGHSLGGRRIIKKKMVVSLSINCLVYLYADQQILSSFQSRPLEGQDPWGVLTMSRKLAETAKIPIPQIVITNSFSPQALSVGRSPERSAIVITDGLLQRFSGEELRAVLAYCIANIKRQDTLAYLVGAAFCRGILLITQSLDAVVRWLIGTKKKSYAPHSHLFTYLFAPLCHLILKLAVRPQSYYDSDQLAASLISEPQIYARTLWKLRSYSMTLPYPVPAAYAHAFIVNPLTNKGWARYFHTQPSVEQRISRLIGYYPI